MQYLEGGFRDDAAEQLPQGALNDQVAPSLDEPDREDGRIPVMRVNEFVEFPWLAFPCFCFRQTETEKPVELFIQRDRDVFFADERLAAARRVDVSDHWRQVLHATPHLIGLKVREAAASKDSDLVTELLEFCCERIHVHVLAAGVRGSPEGNLATAIAMIRDQRNLRTINGPELKI